MNGVITATEAEELRTTVAEMEESFVWGDM
jgi:hypothetical protein